MLPALDMSILCRNYAFSGIFAFFVGVSKIFTSLAWRRSRQLFPLSLRLIRRSDWPQALSTLLTCPDQSICASMAKLPIGHVPFPLHTSSTIRRSFPFNVAAANFRYSKNESVIADSAPFAGVGVRRGFFFAGVPPFFP